MFFNFQIEDKEYFQDRYFINFLKNRYIFYILKVGTKSCAPYQSYQN